MHHIQPSAHQQRSEISINSNCYTSTFRYAPGCFLFYLAIHRSTMFVDTHYRISVDTESLGSVQVARSCQLATVLSPGCVTDPMSTAVYAETRQDIRRRTMNELVRVLAIRPREIKGG